MKRNGLWIIPVFLVIVSLPVTAEKPKIGQVFPDIQGETLSGEKVSVSQLRGRPVLVDFWATWCGPCLAEIPHLLDLYEKYHPHGFEIVAVSLDNNLESLRSYVEKKEIPWPILYTPGGWRSKWPRELEIHAIPAFFLLNEEGVLVTRKPRRRRLEEWVRHLLDPEYPLAPNLDELFETWREAPDEVRREAADQILRWAGSPATVDDANSSLWKELMVPIVPEENLEFLAAVADRINSVIEKANHIDTRAYAVYRMGKPADAADLEKKALEVARTEKDSDDDYTWLMEARLALYLAKSGQVEEASRMFRTALQDREKARVWYEEAVDWLAETADLLDGDYPEAWEEYPSIDQQFHVARWQGDRRRVLERYDRMLDYASEEDPASQQLAILFGRFAWPEDQAEVLYYRDDLPVSVACTDATGETIVLRGRRVDVRGDFALLVDLSLLEGTGEPNVQTPVRLSVEGRHISPFEKVIRVQPGEVRDLGTLVLKSR